MDVAELKPQLAEQMQEVAEFLLPGGRLSDDQMQWWCGDRHGAEGESLKLELYGDKAGIWNDFAEEEGGDILDIWKSVRDVDFKTALKEARQFLEDRNSLDTNSQVNGKKQVMSKHNNKNKTRTPMKSEPTHIWYYRNSAGEVIGKVVRRDAIDGSCKQVKPCFKPDGNGGFLAGIPSGLNDKRPLYGDRPGKKGDIIVTEGEKTADAVRQMGFPACTSMGGCGSADKTDWSPLKGARQVLIWADNDDPGLKYANAVANQIFAVAPEADIRILTWGDEKDDAVDFINSVLKADGFIWNGYEKNKEIKRIVPKFKVLLKTAKKWRPAEVDLLKVLKKYLVTEEDAKSIKSQTHKYKKVVPGGQLFILVGVGGSGKTTVMEYICSQISGDVYYFNMDTPSVHIPEARKRAEAGRYHLLCPDLKGGIDQVVNDLKIINQEGADLSDVTIVLDTIKKIMDMVDKGDIKRLMKVLRSLTAKGATIIGLGHTNKYANDDGWPNYEGTVDLRNDCDAMACLIHHRKEDDPDTIITSLYWGEQGWPHAKDRGEVEPVTWVIDRSDNRKVTELDTWVDTKRANDELIQLEKTRDIVADIVRFLATESAGANQSQVVKAMSTIPYSRRQVLKHLDMYEGRIWSQEAKKELNAKVYNLLPAADEYLQRESDKEALLKRVVGA